MIGLTRVAPLVLLAAATTLAGAQNPPPLNAIAARVDPYVEKQRVVVMSDIANEPDDQMSLVRFLVYSNEFDVEGLIASTPSPDHPQHWPLTACGAAVV